MSIQFLLISDTVPSEDLLNSIIPVRTGLTDWGNGRQIRNFSYLAYARRLLRHGCQPDGLSDYEETTGQQPTKLYVDYDKLHLHSEINSRAQAEEILLRDVVEPVNALLGTKDVESLQGLTAADVAISHRCRIVSKVC